MATNFPTSLDTLTNPTSSDSLSSPSHSAQHANANDAIEALQAKVGADSSAVTSSLDYKVAQLEAASTGKILQVVSTTKTDTFTSTNTSFVDITGLTVTITPSSTSSKILIIAQVSHSQGGSFGSQIRLNGGNVAGNYVGDAGTGQQQAVSGLLMHSSFRGDYSVFNSSLNYLDSPATTSATTYAVQIACGNGGTVQVNRSNVDNTNTAYTRGASTITVMEVAA